MPLTFTGLKILTEGIHDVGLAEVKEAFGCFVRSGQRVRLFEKLADFVDQVKKAGIAESIIVDGSFIMQCIDEPGDIDLILVLPKDWDMTRDLKPFEYNLISKKAVKRNFPFDLKTVRSQSPEEAEWINFYSKVNIKWYEAYGFAAGARKGLVRIAI
jgi:hypothetical protein